MSNYPDDIRQYDHDPRSPFYDDSNDLIDGYTAVSEPIEIKFKLKNRDELTNQMVAQMREQITETRANAESKCKILEEKIQSLLALPSS